MKKEVKAIIAVVVVIWVFVMGFEIGILKGTKDTKAMLSTTQMPTTQYTTTTMPSTQATTVSTEASTSVSATGATDAAATTAAPIPGAATDVSALSKEQITAKVVEYVNKVKAEQNMTAVKKETIQVTVDNCSVPSLTGTVNDVVQKIVGDPSTHTFTFVNGQGTNAAGETVSAHDAIPPSNDAHKDAQLDPSGVASATAKKDANGNTVYTVVLVAESTTISNGVPTHNSGIIGYLNLGAINIPVPGISITEANMNYPGSTVEVTVDSNDKVIKLVNKMPMSGSGTAKVGFTSANAEFSGGLDESWEFSY
ncbi:MAG: hypothetical protein ACI4GC_04175 [Acutalibacteraceae bacterium]